MSLQSRINQTEVTNVALTPEQQQLATARIEAECRFYLKDSVQILADNEQTLLKTFGLLADQYLIPFARSVHLFNSTVVLLRERLIAAGIHQDLADGSAISIDELTVRTIAPVPKLYELLDTAANSPQLSSEDK